jgi:hypothetical protein
MHGRLEGSDLKLKPANMGTGEAKISGFDEFTRPASYLAVRGLFRRSRN